jgi:hypothetical protein
VRPIPFFASYRFLGSRRFYSRSDTQIRSNCWPATYTFSEPPFPSPPSSVPAIPGFSLSSLSTVRLCPAFPFCLIPICVTSCWRRLQPNNDPSRLLTTPLDRCYGLLEPLDLCIRIPPTPNFLFPYLPSTMSFYALRPLHCIRQTKNRQRNTRLLQVPSFLLRIYLYGRLYIHSFHTRVPPHFLVLLLFCSSHGVPIFSHPYLSTTSPFICLLALFASNRANL